jgi:uncharacterized protein YpbB
VLIMNYRSAIILILLEKFSNERTVHSVYHLLKGKKTSQTIQDAKLFNAEKFFATMKHMTRQQFDQIIKRIMQQQLITITQNNNYTITMQGQKVINDFRKNTKIPSHLNGLLYSSISKTFWERFSLFVQVLSHATAGKQKYSPIIINERAAWWVKKNIPHASKRIDIANALYEECLLLLEQLPESEASIFTMRLSRVNRIGYTNEQVATKLGMDLQEVHFIFQSACHFIVGQVLNNKEGFPVLSKFFDGERNEITMTKTAQDTLKLLQFGKSLTDIMKIRQLKRSTIEDHIVEIASNEKHFGLEPYVTQSEQSEIHSAINKANSKKLKEIKEYTTNDQITYFKIRLVLARGGSKK